MCLTSWSHSVCSFVTGFLHSPCVQAHPCDSMCRSPPFEGQVIVTLDLLFLVSCIQPFVAVKDATVNMGVQISVWIPFLFGWILWFYLFGYLFIQQGSVFILGPRAFEANPPALSCITRVWFCLLDMHLEMGLQFWLWFFFFLLAVVRLLQWALSCLDDASKSIQCSTLTLQPEAWPRRVTNTRQGDHFSTNNQSECKALDQILALQNQQPYPFLLK